MTAAEYKQYAISRKILLLRREGYPQRQATAIAFRMWKDGELKQPKPGERKRQKDLRRRRWYDQRKRMRRNDD
jgi:hypothetical protein